MQEIANQLRSVRRTGRVLLVVRRVAQWLSAVVPVLIGLGLLDYAVRLPGALRLVIGLGLLLVAGVWLGTRLSRAVRFWPSLAELALRAERLYPRLSGSLASAVAFSLEPAGYAEPASTASLARRAVSEAQQQAHGVSVRQMINYGPTVKACALALLSVGVLLAIVAATPQASATAASRWFMPLGDAEWPKVNQVEALTDEGAVFAADGKVRLRAQVTRGWEEGMRMTVRYRVLDPSGEGQWQSVRVAAQRPASPGEQPVYEALLDVPPPIARSLMAGRQASATLEVSYSAGDDTTPIQTHTLAARPEISAVRVDAAPPEYALGLIAPRRAELHEQAGQVASTSAYVGSDIRMEVRFNKPIPTNQAQAAATEWVRVIQGDIQTTLRQPDSANRDLAEGFTLSWTLAKAVAGSFALTDGFGLASLDSERQFRIQAIEDELPAVVLLKPALDESVLPGASVLLEALVEDDVAAQSLQLEVVVPDRENTPEDAEVTATRTLESGELITTGRFESLQIDHNLVLEPLALLPGDEVLITAVGTDVYELNGERHDPVRSETRRLRVITERQLADQVRRVLRGVRNTAQSLDRNQRIMTDRMQSTDPAESAEQQGEIGRRLTAQQETIEQVRERLARNNPQGLEPLEKLLNRAEALVGEAREASDQAQNQLGESAEQQEAAEQAEQDAAAAEQAGDSDQAKAAAQAQAEAQAQQQAAREQAEQSQAAVREQLAELVAALDVGESVGEVESELAELQSDAEAVARDTRELLPKTIGQKPEDLDAALRQALNENAEAQRQLADRAQELIDKMRATADEIGENGETPEQRATAKTLAEAADIAERQGLEENTEQAAEQLDENQIADAAARQQQAAATLEQMLQELGRQQQRKQEELERLLQELGEKIAALVDDQREQLAATQAAGAAALGAREQPQFALRRRTLLVEAEALQSPETTEVGSALGEAVRDQGEAVKAIRVDDQPATVRSQGEALAHLEEALALISDAQDQQEQEQRDQERFALRQAYLGLADRQDALINLVAQHEREGDYSRRDWRQINRLYREPLDDRSFEQEQQAIRTAAAQLGEKAGEAIVYQSLHRRMDQSAASAENRLSDRVIDSELLDQQARVSRMLRAMGDALDDTADPDKFEDDQDRQDQQGGEGEGEGEPPPLVPDLAEIKLLREIMIVLRNETAQLADAQGLTEAQRAARLAELAEQQRELKQLGDQLIDKLREQMQGPMPEPPPNP